MQYFEIRPTGYKNGNIRIEVVADSLRVGKTTAVKVIADGLRAQGKTVFESYEDWQHNPYLKKSYTDPAKNFLESQKWFIKRKLQQIKAGVRQKGIFIQDVSPEMDFGYAATNLRLLRMSRQDFDEYKAYYLGLDWSKAPKPDLLVYLTISDKELISRAQATKREFETVEDNYFLTMKKVNREWLKKLISSTQFSNSQMKILKINTDKLDFANNDNDKKELVMMVNEAILGISE
jgi:deoxyadenosine/deoxycytidine kinase